MILFPPHQGIDENRSASYEWLRIGFEDPLYVLIDSAGFTPTNGGLTDLTDLESAHITALMYA